ncbi:MAG: hypothetical protein LBK25_02870 [Treponema sp.]|nr:hypothetical protein [Treponema sp.]
MTSTQRRFLFVGVRHLPKLDSLTSDTTQFPSKRKAFQTLSTLFQPFGKLSAWLGKRCEWLAMLCE